MHINVRWGTILPLTFTVSKGMKQGGIILPIIFNVYIDGLRILLSNSNIRGLLGRTTLKHLCYVDDL